MSQRALLTAGIVSIAAAVLIGAFGLTNGGSRFPMGAFVGSSGKAISMDEAQQSVQSFLDRGVGQDLKIDELMEFQQNFYALIKENGTGLGAFELLVSKSNGAVAPEPGPNMMWNTKYSMMGGSRMMGGLGSFRIAATAGPMSVSSDQATQIAQSWLDRNLPGDIAGTPDAFYGYYTFHFEKNSHIAGMLSVNGYTGHVWYHTWHGAFIQARDFGVASVVGHTR